MTSTADTRADGQDRAGRRDALGAGSTEVIQGEFSQDWKAT